MPPRRQLTAAKRLPPSLTAPRRRASSGKLLEFSREVELVGEAALLSDLCDGVAGVEQKVRGSFKPFGIELLCGRRLAGDTAELEEMLAGGAGCAGDLLERDWVAQ